MSALMNSLPRRASVPPPRYKSLSVRGSSEPSSPIPVKFVHARLTPTPKPRDPETRMGRMEGELKRMEQRLERALDTMAVTGFEADNELALRHAAANGVEADTGMVSIKRELLVSQLRTETLEQRVDILRGQSERLFSHLGRMEERRTLDATKMKDLEVKCTGHETEIMELEADHERHTDEIIELKESLVELQEKIYDGAVNLEDSENRIHVLEADVAHLRCTAEEDERTISQLEEEDHKTSNALMEQQARVTTLERKLVVCEAQIASLRVDNIKLRRDLGKAEAEEGDEKPSKRARVD
ncbi:hypothetical protein C8J57DRAFT_1512838 [Mycena rebaudengoi]|nr:hypothetical protein C8J57DRAFT_1512838 [Mycena rebaudengoi]